MLKDLGNHLIFKREQRKTIDRKLFCVFSCFSIENNDLFRSSTFLVNGLLRRTDFQIDLPALRAALAEMAIEELPITGSYTEKLIELPPVHKDPFDRMLIAQSMTEPLVLLTNDAILTRYWDGVMLVS